MWAEAMEKWEQLAVAASERWDRPTLEDLAQTQGNRSRLIRLLQLHYGLEERDAMRQADAFVRSLDGQWR